MPKNSMVLSLSFSFFSFCFKSSSQNPHSFLVVSALVIVANLVTFKITGAINNPTNSTIMARKKFQTGTLEYSTNKIKGIFAKRLCMSVRYVKTGFSNKILKIDATDIKSSDKS